MPTNIAMDATIMSTLMSCPRLVDYRFNKQLQAKGGKSNSLECGSLAHVILEHYNRAIIHGASRVEAIDIGYKFGSIYVMGGEPAIDRALNKPVIEPDEPMLNTPEESDKYNIGWRWVFTTMEQYFEYWKNDSFTTIAAEEVRGEIIYQDDELRVLWKAKYDKIIDTPNGIIGADYKTMKQRRDTMKLNAQFMGQCILLKSRSVMIDKIGFQTSLKPEEKFTRSLISYSADALSEFCNDIVPHYAHMIAAYAEADHWPPNFTHCENKFGKCNMYEVCESDRGMRDELIQINFIKGKKWDPTND